MLPEVDIFIGNYTIIDKEVYGLWINGYSITEAVSELQQSGALETWGASLEILTSDISDHYRIFGMLEKLLLTPVKLSEEWTFQLHPSVQRYVIERYYDFDDNVIREILGKKLTSRTRKDLDDVSEKTGVSIRSCRRQFDNVKRILKQVDGISGSVVQNIQLNFLLPLELAKKYGAIVFLMNVRFETSKRRLNYLTLDDFVKCSWALMSGWTSAFGNAQNVDDSDFDREFLCKLKDLKVILEREKEHRNVTLSHLRGKIPDGMCSEVESNFKTYSRSLIGIATSLNNARDLKDFFVDVVEKVVDPCRQARWKGEELQAFLKVYTDAGLALDSMSNDLPLKQIWERYMSVMQFCICQLFHS